MAILQKAREDPGVKAAQESLEHWKAELDKVADRFIEIYRSIL